MKRRKQVKILRHALAFYANPRRYFGPNISPPIEDDEYAPRESRFVYDAVLDSGKIARKALKKTAKKMRIYP